MSLERIPVETREPYEVLVGPGALARLDSLVGPPLAVLTDTTVERLHRERLGELTRAPCLAVTPGEGSKSLEELGHVLDFLVEADLDRSSTLVAFGGGVVGDLGGLAASLYMRGIALVQAPTTLLAQCDSSIGGKTAVNLSAGKNLAGTFHQPRAVVCDTETLATLSPGELRSGLGEAVKSALVGDPELLGLLERRASAILAADPGVLAEVVTRSARVKATVVAADEREAGERRKLNLGHTFAHAIERVLGYGRVPHGVAVGVGLVLALETARRVGRLEDPDLPPRVSRVLDALGMPISLGALGARVAPEALLAAMRHDKKGRAGEPELVLPVAAGRVLSGCRVDADLLAGMLAA